MRTLPLAAKSILAALCLTACEATGPNDGTDKQVGGNSTAAPTITVTPAGLIFRVYAFAPQRDPPTQMLAVNRVGGGSMVWGARSSAGWISLGHPGGQGPGQLQVAVSRASLHLGLNGYRPQALTGTITISSAGAPTLRVPVSVLISYLPPIKVAPGAGPGSGKKDD